MEQLRRIVFLLLYLLPCVVSLSSAKPMPNDELWEKSLEELMSITFETASKYQETLTEAASISSVITAEEIQRFGANSLYEVFERITSVYMTGSNFFPKNVTAMRGNLHGHYDNHILVLVNGRPIRESYSGGVNFAIYNAFPLAIIKRIEVIRGPGSALYGTNAYSGVINIITKDEVAPEHVSLSVSKGSLQSESVELFGQHNNDFAIEWAVKYFSEQGWNFSATDGNGVTESKNFGEQNLGMFISSNYKNFEFNGFYVASEQDFLGASVNWLGSPNLEEREIHSDRLFLDIGHNSQLSEDWRLETNLSYSEMEFDHYNYVASSQDIFLEVVNHWQISKSLRLILGATGWYQTVDSSPRLRAAPVPEFSSTWYSLYSQLDYKVTDNLTFIIGGQLNKSEQAKSDFVPRIASLYKFNDKIGVKLLYAEAFRAAFGVETGFDLILTNDDGSIRGGLRGNPSLTPESIKTTDLQFYYHDEDYQLALTFFDSKQSNLIARERANDNVLDFINSGEIESNGYEIEAKLNLDKQFHLVAGYSHQSNECYGIKNHTPAPNNMLKIGGIYYFGHKHSIAIFDNYIGEAQDLSVLNPNVEIVNPSAKQFHLVSLNTIINLGELLAQKQFDNANIELFVYNLLDEDIYDPDFVGKVVNTLPSHSGRTLTAQLKMRF